MQCAGVFTVNNASEMENIISVINVYSPGADSENLDCVSPPEEHGFYGIFCLFGSPASILKTLPLLKCVRKTL